MGSQGEAHLLLLPMLDFSAESGTGEVIAALLAWMGQQERQMLKRRIRAGID